MGAVETLICFENLEIDRLTLKNSASGEETVVHLNKAQQTDQSHFVAAGVMLALFHPSPTKGVTLLSLA